MRYISGMINEKIKHQINKLELFDSGAYGYAIKAYVEDDPLFIIKTPKNSSNDCLHESFIGLYGTNKLRKYIPNFSYVYGFIKSTVPMIYKNKIITWCDCPSRSYNYIVYENINPSVKLNEYIKTCNGKQFLNIYLQVVLSLMLADKLIGFTHYDLNHNNILIRQLEEPITIEYEKYKIKTNVIATIIDYGMSLIKYNNEYYGVRSNTTRSYGIYDNITYIMQDCYRLLMSCIIISHDSDNNKVFGECKKIFKFFTSDNSYKNIVKSIKEQSKCYFAIPMYNFNMENFVQHIGINDINDEKIIKNPKFNMLSFYKNKACNNIYIDYNVYFLKLNKALLNCIDFNEYRDIYKYTHFIIDIIIIRDIISIINGNYNEIVKMFNLCVKKIRRDYKINCKKLNKSTEETNIYFNVTKRALEILEFVK